MDGIAERRSSPRRAVDALVRFEGENFMIYSRAVDVSDSGVFLATHYLLDPETAITLRFLDREGEGTDRPARVVRMVGEPGVHGELRVGLGVAFRN